MNKLTYCTHIERRMEIKPAATDADIEAATADTSLVGAKLRKVCLCARMHTVVLSSYVFGGIIV